MNSASRQAGILLHITSLPTIYGIGTIGDAAFKLIDFMAKANLKLWQILPLTPTGYGDSPYQSFSSNGLNYYMIDLEELIKEGLVTKRQCDNLNFGQNLRIDYELIYKKKTKILKEAFTKFDLNDPNFVSFRESNFANDYALFMTLKTKFQGKPWYEWPEEYKNYTLELEEKIKVEDEVEYLFWVFTQYIFTKQWTKLHEYAKSKGVEIIGDIPIYLAYDSVDVWKYPYYFNLDENKNMINVAGCPPDAFSSLGQLWGNPTYNWPRMKEDGYKWWHERINNTLKFVDILRIDHFRAFDRYYAIPAGSENAIHGSWVDGPKLDLFKDILNLKIIAEDLGVLDDGVYKLMQDVGYPGMKILEFAFDGNPKNEHKPSNYNHNFVAYTGTHDNMPLYQYILDLTLEQKQIFIADLAKEAALLGFTINANTDKDIVWSVIELGFRSIADRVVIPIQDYLCQDGSSRMNLPSNLSNSNWSYRIKYSDLSDELAAKIKALVDVSHR